jgi:hypothetical protein
LRSLNHARGMKSMGLEPRDKVEQDLPKGGILK